MFTDPDGKIDTTLTDDQFNVNGNANDTGQGEFGASYDAKSKTLTNTTSNGWTSEIERESDVHFDTKDQGNGGSTMTFSFGEPTGGDASGGLNVTFDGGGNEDEHIRDEGKTTWEDNFDGGAGSTEKNKGESKSKYTLGDVFGSESNGGITVTLNLDGTITVGGSFSYDEDYTFDQIDPPGVTWRKNASRLNWLGCVSTAGRWQGGDNPCCWWALLI